MKKCLYFVILAAGLFTIESWAFAGSSSIVRGTVLDETNAPIEMVTVTLQDMRDTNEVKGVVTSKDGSFTFQNIPKGRYSLSISCIGYKRLVIPDVEVTGQQPEVNLGAKRLEQAAYQTKAAQVTGEKVEQEFKADKKIINVAQNFSATGGTALDVLQNQPSVRVDADGTVYLRGSTNYVVQVNGRPSVLQGADALKQVPANTIETIELITNPSASHEAEGSAGIINLVLKKQVANNMNGILNTGTASRDKYNTDGTLNYKKDNVNLSGGFDYRNSANFADQDIGRKSSTTLGEQATNTELDLRIRRENYSGRANLDYTLSDGSMFSIGGSGGRVNFDLDVNTKIDNQVSAGTKTFAKSVQKTELNADYYSTTLYYNRSFLPKTDELSFDASLTRVILPNTEKGTQYITDGSYTPANNTPSIRFIDNDSKRWEGRLKANYKYKFSEKSAFETGLQSNLFIKDIDYAYSVYDYSVLDYKKLSSMSNVFKFTNNVHAAFATYSNELLGLQYEIGLRAEYTDRILEQKTLGQEYKYQKVHAFPSVNFSTDLAPGQQMQFSYSRRVNRPFDQQLNPFSSYSDEYTISRGNPYLKPEFTNSFELNYQRYFEKAFLSVQGYLRLTQDGINNSFSNDNGKLVITFENTEKSSAAGTEISGSLPIASWWKFDPSANLYNYHVVSTVNNYQTTDDRFTWNARISNNFTLAQSTRLQVTAYYQAKNLFTQGTVEPFFFWTMSLRQEFFERALIATLSATNLMHPMLMKLKNTGSDFVSTARIQNEAPILSLSLSYNFNNFKRSSRPNEGVDVNVGTGL